MHENMYNWQYEKWAEFVYNEELIQENALRFAELSGEIFGIFKTLNSEKQQNQIVDIMISEALKTSEIEGEMLSREDVRSSFLNKLGLHSTLKNIKDRRAENIALLMIEVRNNVSEKLSEKMLKQWHAMLFANSKYINAGTYRKSAEPMQIISGTAGKEKVHYEAPPSAQVPTEMKNFVKWYNGCNSKGNTLKIIVKTAIAHLYFESIHPFEDGNGRVGRVLIEKCLSQSLGRPVLMSLSQIIEKNRNEYYAELKRAQTSLCIDSWLLYFSQLLIDAQKSALDILDFSVKKTQFFDTHRKNLNARQNKALNKMLDAGKEGFEGGMTAKKYMSITKTTKATATRDLQELAEKNILTPQGEGRATHYVLDF
jgi:Fic family protein